MRGEVERYRVGKRGKGRLKNGWGGGPSGKAAETDREGEGGEESGRGREKGGVIVSERGGDSLVDGQKDKGMSRVKGICQRAG